MSEKYDANDPVVKAGRSAIEEAMSEESGIIFGMVATVDGFEVASITDPNWDIPANRLAAMASSGHALGDTVAKELTSTECQNIIIDAYRLSIIFLAIPGYKDPPLILGVAATKNASLGSVLYTAERCAKRVGEA
jgi:predicted regulator of Ras-like GTPase activity (Roadblock/LC7/MglB family)